MEIPKFISSGSESFTNSVKAAGGEPKKFSTFEGVFTPTIMTIIGVVIFLRAGFVVGQAGIYQALAILCIAKLITTLTTLSISAIATNTEVKGGGAYYLISRSIGPEFGGAIALTIFMSQSIAIPFYIIGFAEAIVLTFPLAAPYFAYIAYGVFVVVAILSLKGAEIVTKTQFVVMVVICLSIAAYTIGAAQDFSPEVFKENTAPYREIINEKPVMSSVTVPTDPVTEIVADTNDPSAEAEPVIDPDVVSEDAASYHVDAEPESVAGRNNTETIVNIDTKMPVRVPAEPFWPLFAIYFTAVIGILAGVNMSGNLKNPTRSIPQGTLLAILVGFAVYASQIILIGGSLTREQLILDSYGSMRGLLGIVTGVLVVGGVLAATLSSALSTILGAPRVLQSLAQDKLLKPVNIFAKTTKDGEPRRALILTLAIGLAVIYFACGRGGGSGGGGLNAVASLVSMFFLLTYGIINLAAFMEAFSRNPSFRPRFKFFHWFTALVGMVMSFGVTMFINPLAAIAAGIVFAGIYFYVRKYVMSASFGDARRGFYYSRTRDNLLTLATLPVHPKNWRPTVAAFVGDPGHRLHIVKYADWLSSGRGILTIASLIKGNFTEKVDERTKYIASFNDFLSKERIKAFPEVLVTPDFNTGISHFLQANSIGPIKSNFAIFGWSSDPSRAGSFLKSIQTAASLHMSVGLIYGKDLPDPPQRRKRRTIDIWWRGMRNGSLMVILAHLMSLNSEWSGAKIRILRVVYTPEEKEFAAEELETLIEAARMDVGIEVILSDDTFPNLLRRYSGMSTVIFMGFTVDANTDPVRFQESYINMLHGMPTIILIQSTGDADLLS